MRLSVKSLEIQEWPSRFFSNYHLLELLNPLDQEYEYVFAINNNINVKTEVNMLKGACYLSSCLVLLQEPIDVKMASGKFTGKKGQSEQSQVFRGAKDKFQYIQ